MRRVALHLCSARWLRCRRYASERGPVRSFEVGKTTYQDVVRKLGEPTQRMVSADGSKQAFYMYVEAQARPETFIPIVGAFVGGSDARSNSASFFFDKNDILTDYRSSSGAMGMGMGLSAGHVEGRIPDQPKQAP